MAGPFIVGRNGVVIGAPPQQVFNYLADMTRHGEWNHEPDFKVTARPAGPPAAGSVFRREKTGEMQAPLILRGGMGDSLVTMVKTMTIVTYEPYHTLVFETRNSYNGLLHSVEKLIFKFWQDPEGTQVSLVSEVEAMIPSAFIGPVYAIRMVRAAFDRLLGGRLAGLFPQITVGPHLSRIKKLLETRQIAGEI